MNKRKNIGNNNSVPQGATAKREKRKSICRAPDRWSKIIEMNQNQNKNQQNQNKNQQNQNKNQQNQNQNKKNEQNYENKK